MTQLELVSERARQHQARDAALDRLEVTRSNLIAAGTRYALEIAKHQGQVTSVEVFRAMRQAGFELDAFDPRWMGAVFRAGRGWKRAGWRSDGSHGRPVAVWEMRK